MKVRGPDELLI